jgi:hypothetical protein
MQYRNATAALPSCPVGLRDVALKLACLTNAWRQTRSRRSREMRSNTIWQSRHSFAYDEIRHLGGPLCSDLSALEENDAGHGVFEYDQPSTTFGQFDDERVTAVARGLDAACARLGRRGGVTPREGAERSTSSRSGGCLARRSAARRSPPRRGALRPAR